MAIFRGILLFVAGIVCTLLLVRPSTERSAVVQDTGAKRAAARLQPVAPAEAPSWRDPGDHAPGIPSLLATSPDRRPQINPKSGQRRAVARALAALEQQPPEIEAAPVDTAAAAALGEGLRAALQQLEPQGETP